MMHEKRDREPAERSVVDEASAESFPASDAPAWVSSDRAVASPPGQGVVAGIFATEDEAARAVRKLIQAHFDPPHDLSVIVSHRRHHEDVPVPETLDVVRWARIGAAVGVVLGTAAVTLTGMTVGPLTLVAAGPIGVALEGAFSGGAVGFAMGALHGLMESEEEVDFHAAHIREGVVWVGVHARGARAEEARRILADAGAKHFQGR